jgi:hypothetical protein
MSSARSSGALSAGKVILSMPACLIKVIAVSAPRKLIFWCKVLCHAHVILLQCMALKKVI